jgi:hypothetical protein
MGSQQAGDAPLGLELAQAMWDGRSHKIKQYDLWD